MRHTTLFTLILTLALAAGAQRNDSAEVLLRAAMDKETVDGDLKAAIEQYKKVLARAGSNRAVAAQALVGLGICYERQGNAEARKTYDRVLREFADQPEAVRQARGRLAGLGNRPFSTGLAVRQIWSGIDGSVRLWGQISPDGRYLSHTVWGKGDLAVRDLESGQTRLVTRFPDGNRDGVEFSAWSPDGKRIAFSWETKDRWELRVINFDGTGMKTIYTTKHLQVPGLDGRHVDPDGWSADGSRVLATDWSRGEPNHLIWVNVADGAFRTVKSGNGLGGAKVSPDGRTIAYQISGDNNIRTMTADGGSDGIAASHSGRQSTIGWSPDGKHLLITRANGGEMGLWAVPMNGGNSVGDPVLIRRELGIGVRGQGITRSGAVYYETRQAQSDIYTADMNPMTGKITSKPHPVPVDRFGSNVLPRWSPGGRELVYYWSQGERQISIYSFQTSQVRRLPQASFAGGGSVCWAGPNAIAFTAADGGPGVAWVRMDLATSAITRLYRWPDVSRIGRNCDASGQNIAMVHRPGVEVLDVASGTEKRLYEIFDIPASSLPSISPDGSIVAFVNHTPPGSSLMAVNRASGQARELLKIQFPVQFQRLWGISWSPDNRYVYYVKKMTGEAPWELFRIPASGGEEESTGLKVPGLRDISVSPDGARIAFSSGDTLPEVWTIENPLAGRN